MKIVSQVVRGLAVMGLFLAAPSASADTVVGFYLGAGYWDVDADGRFGASDALTEFDLDNEGKGFAWLAFEHPIPLVPNIKLRYNELDTEGKADDLAFEFGDFRFAGKSDVEANIDHLDIILYYELLDREVLWLDLGVNLKYADYEIVISGEIVEDDETLVSGRTSESYHGVVPMLYGAAGVGLPFSGLGLFLEGNWTSYDDHSAYDTMAGVSWLAMDNVVIDLQLQAGYRRIDVDVEDLSGIWADARFEGAFAAFQLHF